MKVLLDLIDPALRALWEGVLDDHGHVVVNHEPVDLVILELTPGSHGALDSCRRIRQSTAGGRPGILVLVHPDRAAEMVAALKAGADGVLVGLPDRRAAVAHLSSLERRQHAVRGAADARPMAERPVDDAPSAVTGHRKPIKRLARKPPTGRGTILLIDDEASVRLPLRRALEHCGYRVLEATDGRQGLDIFARSGERIDLAVVDQRMPGMSGQQVVEELKRQVASLPVIMISGHRQGAGAGTTDDAPHPDAFLRKPFELMDLARTVRRLTAA